MPRDPAVWLCVHGERADECTSCDDEDTAINGVRELVQCGHGLMDMDGYCVDCGAYCE